MQATHSSTWLQNGRIHSQKKICIADSAAAEAIRHIWQAHIESPVVKKQRILSEPPGERKLRVVQEAQTWRPSPLGANLF